MIKIYILLISLMAFIPSIAQNESRLKSDSIPVTLGVDTRQAAGGIPTYCQCANAILVNCTEGYYNEAKKRMTIIKQADPIAKGYDSEILLYYENINSYLTAIQNELSATGLQKSFEFSFLKKEVEGVWMPDSSAFVVNIETPKGYRWQMTFPDGLYSFGICRYLQEYHLLDLFVREPMQMTSHIYYNVRTGDLYPMSSTPDFCTADSVLVFTDYMNTMSADGFGTPAVGIVNLKTGFSFSFPMHELLYFYGTPEENWMLSGCVINTKHTLRRDETCMGYEFLLKLSRYDENSKWNNPVILENKYYRVINRPFGF